jgi:hypothetical protein
MMARRDVLRRRVVSSEAADEKKETIEPLSDFTSATTQMVLAAVMVQKWFRGMRARWQTKKKRLGR